MSGSEWEIPIWAEWWADDIGKYISAEEYERIKVFEPYRLQYLVSVVNQLGYTVGGKSVSGGKKGYEDYPYIRAEVTSRDIVQAVREVLGVKEGEAIPLVFDGKVTPVVVLNDSIKYSRYELLGSVSLTVSQQYYGFVDNKVAIKESIEVKKAATPLVEAVRKAEDTPVTVTKVEKTEKVIEVKDEQEILMERLFKKVR